MYRQLNKFNNKGQAIVEFALIIIVFLILLISVVDFSRGYMVKNTLNQAAREGARYAATLPNLDSNKDEVVDVVITRIGPSGIIPKEILVDTTDYEIGEPIKVTVTNDFHPFFANFLPGFDTFELKGISLIRHEEARTLGTPGPLPPGDDDDDDITDDDVTDDDDDDDITGDDDDDITDDDIIDDDDDVTTDDDDITDDDITPDDDDDIIVDDDDVTDDDDDITDDDVTGDDDVTTDDDDVTGDDDDITGDDDDITDDDDDDINIPPIARINAIPYRGYFPLTVALDALQSIDPDGYIESYYWELGEGGATSTVKVLEHTYPDPFTYTVTLTVTDNEGATDTATEKITVEKEPAADDDDDDDDNQPPVAKIEEESASSRPYYAPAEVNVNGDQSYDPDGVVVSWSWGFGSTDEDPAPITYSSPGRYTISLTVRDNDGRRGSTSITVQILDPGNEAPTACFNYSPSDPDEDTDIRFDASCSYDDKGIVSYSWSGAFSGSGVTKTKELSSGWKYITLTVADAEGATDSTTKRIYVDEIPRILPD